MKTIPHLALAATLFVTFASSQQSQQPVPDAPSATRPATPFPAGTRPAPKEQPDRPDEDAIPVEQQSNARQQQSAQAESPAQGEEVLERFRAVVSLISVPVTVKDGEGRAVLGLTREDFTVLENGKPQRISFFTSDPSALSAAIVIDQGMSDTAMRKVNAGLEALAASFAPYDEVSLYTYSNVVTRRADWQGAGENFSAVLTTSRSSGRSGGVPVAGGPMAAGPTVNGRPFDPSMGSAQNRPVIRESHVLNDAVLRAANDLVSSKRDPRRRKIIFVISDGREDGSTASFEDVKNLLLTQNISVYALGVDSAAIPVYEKLARINIPHFGTGNILPKYVSATGGQLITEFTREEITRAYAELAGQARNQYTLGYSSNVNEPGYRSIEVLVNRPNLRVFARDGYFPLPSRNAVSGNR